MSRSVVVVGGGVAGLVAARHLAEGGADVTVYEQRETVGGRVRSRQTKGCTLDYGFQVLFTAYPAVRRELDLDALDLRAFKPGAVIARPGQRSVLSDPLRDPNAAVESLTNPEVPMVDKLRTLALRRDLSVREYESLFERPDSSIRASLREWGFSERYLSNFIAPFYGGITLDRSLGTSKRVFEYTFKALSEGRTVVPAGGMGEIGRQLADSAEAAGATIETGHAVTELKPSVDTRSLSPTRTGGQSTRLSSLPRRRSPRDSPATTTYQPRGSAVSLSTTVSLTVHRSIPASDCC